MPSIPDRLRPVPQALATDDDVAAAVMAVVQRPIVDRQDMDVALANSGLLAISIPAAFGGADISNAVVADAVGKLSSWHPRAADRLVDHLVALELLRNAGSTEQRRAIFGRVMLGDLFEFAARPTDPPKPRLRRSDLSVLVEHCPPPDAGRTVDWQVVIAAEFTADRFAVVFRAPVPKGPEQAGVSSVMVSPDNVLRLDPALIILAELMREFLRGAVCLGRGQPDAPAMAKTQIGTSDRELSKRLRVERELLDGMVAKVAAVIDACQVNSAPADVERIACLCEALRTARLRCAG